MPKLKTNSGTKKRFKIKGKRTSILLKRRSAERGHNLGKKSTKRKRNLRSPSYVGKSDMKGIKRLLALL